MLKINFIKSFSLFGLCLLILAIHTTPPTMAKSLGEKHFPHPLSTSNQLTSVNGGNNCLTCTIIVALVEQLSIVYNQTAERSLQAMCKFLPLGLFRTTCQNLIKQFGMVIINGYK
jgi:hypothetical protein